MERFLTDGEMAEIRTIAQQRHSTMSGLKTSTPMSSDYWTVAIMGEWLFGEVFDLPVYKGNNPAGDGGVDFMISTVTVDVKTAQKPKYLLWKRDYSHEPAEVLVLAGANPTTQWMRLFGWYWGCLIKHEPYRDFGQAEAHYLEAGELWDMERLLMWKSQLA